MMKKLDVFKVRLTSLLSFGEFIRSHSVIKQDGDVKTYDYGEYTQYVTSVLSFLKDLYGLDHLYHQQFHKSCTANSEISLRTGIGILKSVKNELDHGYLDTVKGLVSAEVFSDFMEMAEHLLEEHYKDAAAVMIGSVLEEHLRQLCQANGIDLTYMKGDDQVTHKTTTLNDNLAKKGVYNKLDQTQVLAWLHLRNNAAHGQYDKYVEEAVILMHKGVLLFMSQTRL